jgi:hypothetical protein
MSYVIPLRRHRSLPTLGMLVIVCLMHADLAVAEPPPGFWNPGQPLPPGPFFGAPAIPRPVPIPPYRVPFPPQVPNPYTLAPITPLPGMSGSTDRCLVVASGQNDPRFLVTASAGIDPGIIKAPRVQGLPVRPARWRSGR